MYVQKTEKAPKKIGEKPEEKAPPHRGIGVQCPRCGKENTLALMVNDTSGLVCCNCRHEMDTADVEELIREWGKILALMNAAPIVDLADYQRRPEAL